jgi:hypothetical protein
MTASTGTVFANDLAHTSQHGIGLASSELTDIKL